MSNRWFRCGAVFVTALSLTVGCVPQAPPPDDVSSEQSDTASSGEVDDAGAVDAIGKGDNPTEPQDAANDDVITDAGDGGDAADDDVADDPDDVWSCDPDFELDDTLYVDIEELDGTEFVDELHGVVADHDGQGYDAAREFMFETLEVRDHGKLECVYTDDEVEPDGTNLPGGQFNTEHTWPQSRGADSEPARSDVHHLFPVDIDANNRRANFEFGHVACDETSCDWHRDESFLGPSADDDREPVFEVQPERRGDIARAILYFSLRYEEPISPEEEVVLREWNCQDPPDEYELARNDDIEQFQQNRNPFIDRPDFVDRIEEF